AAAGLRQRRRRHLRPLPPTAARGGKHDTPRGAAVKAPQASLAATHTLTTSSRPDEERRTMLGVARRASLRVEPVTAFVRRNRSSIALRMRLGSTGIGPMRCVLYGRIHAQHPSGYAPPARLRAALRIARRRFIVQDHFPTWR